MRRDNFRLEVSNVAWLEEGGEPRQPTLTVRTSADADALRERLGEGPDATLTADDVDVTFRFQDGDDEEAAGVLAVADRVTGEFHMEINAAGTDVTAFVAAARRYAERTGDSARYRTRLLSDDEPIVDFEKRTLLVYSSDGELLRQHSLIPSGVEI